jgi:hypothetical protein
MSFRWWNISEAAKEMIHWIQIYNNKVRNVEGITILVKTWCRSIQWNLIRSETGKVRQLFPEKDNKTSRQFSPFCFFLFSCRVWMEENEWKVVDFSLCFSETFGECVLEMERCQPHKHTHLHTCRQTDSRQLLCSWSSSMDSLEGHSLRSRSDW